ncbi:hypothetical protein LTR36_003130 [Oleoguttula mirabilis]|uniref:Uncharacterized protein n=1 Tax=Oleoguttula mirabilis TaxID=1507867 RepID=A0AAV9JX12_9PEZI|nr:hypothetical protein LTR36_003130 [Oleoguttula mirabilis]
MAAASNIHISDCYPLELHYIKALCVQKHYRQCIQACRDILKTAGNSSNDRPVQQTFISFYLGVAHDELARLMHDYSQAKVPAFNQAEQFYREALESLPTSRTRFATALETPAPVDDDPFFDGSSESSCSPTPRPSDDYDPYNYSSPSFPSSPPTSPPMHIRTDSLPTRSPPPSSRETSASDLNDLESHSSFDQIMTPHKVLQRDISRMSLLDDLPAKRPTGLPRTTSTSQGLMRPIRPGSPPKAFHVPPRLPYVGNVSDMYSRLPKLVTRGAPQESPSKTQGPRDIWEEEQSPVQPVSPLGSEIGISNTSTISPVSPATPPHGGSSELGTASDTGVQGTNDGAGESDAVSQHLSAIRAQLQTHLQLLDKAKQSTVSSQAARAMKRASAIAPRAGTPLAPLRARGDSTSTSRPSSSGTSRPGSSSSSGKHDSVISGDGKRMPQTRTYWSFTAEEVKADEKQKRIREGRERGWVRERFRAERYQELAEKALAEL